MQAKQVLLPDRTLTAKDDPCKDGKRSMKQLTMCATVLEF
jgi:hypothetical protein